MTAEADGQMAEAADLNGALERAVTRLVGTTPRGSGWVVRVPLLYPSGSAVSVTALPLGSGDHFKIGDDALGFAEAFGMDVASAYTRAAKEMSEEMGLKYERRRIQLHDVDVSRLPAAIKLVANCSLASVILAGERAQERKANERTDRLIGRLKKVFRDVTRRAPILGASATPWTVDALVKNGDREVVFDFVANHANSVASTSTKFHDLALMESAPVRCALVESKRDLGTLLAVLSQAGKVIEDAAPEQTYRTLAEAA